MQTVEEIKVNSRVETIKEALEKREDFKYWNKAVGVEFEDFIIYEHGSQLVIKRGSKRLGNYYMVVSDTAITQVYFDLSNKSTREHVLKLVADIE